MSSIQSPLALPVQYILNLYCSLSLKTPPWPTPFFSIHLVILFCTWTANYRTARRVSSINRLDHANLLIKTLLWLCFEVRMKPKLSPLSRNSYIIWILLCFTFCYSSLVHYYSVILVLFLDQTKSILTSWPSILPQALSWTSWFLNIGVLGKMSLP